MHGYFINHDFKKAGSQAVICNRLHCHHVGPDHTHTQTSMTNTFIYIHSLHTLHPSLCFPQREPWTSLAVSGLQPTRAESDWIRHQHACFSQHRCRKTQRGKCTTNAHKKPCSYAGREGAHLPHVNTHNCIIKKAQTSNGFRGYLAASHKPWVQQPFGFKGESRPV